MSRSDYGSRISDKLIQGIRSLVCVTDIEYISYEAQSL